MKKKKIPKMLNKLSNKVTLKGGQTEERHNGICVNLR